MIPRRLLLRIFLRTYLVGAVYTMRGFQNVGLVFILHPALEHLYGHDPAALQRARHRYLGLYHTHPSWTPALVGLFLFFEERIAQGVLAPQALAAVRPTVIFTLSGLGDAFFGGGVLTVWAVVHCWLLVCGWWGWALGWMIVVASVFQGFKYRTFLRAYAEGLVFLQGLKRWDLINWARRLKVIGAMGLALVATTVAAPGGLWAMLATGVVAGGGALVATRGLWRLAFVLAVSGVWFLGFAR